MLSLEFHGPDPAAASETKSSPPSYSTSLLAKSEAIPSFETERRHKPSGKPRSAGCSATESLSLPVPILPTMGAKRAASQKQVGQGLVPPPRSSQRRGFDHLPCLLPPTCKHTLGFADGKIARRERERRKGGGHKEGEEDRKLC